MPKAALAAAVRRDDGAAHHIGEMNRRQIGGNRLLRPVTNAADVMRILQAHDHHALLARALDGELHGLKRHRLPDAAVAVHHQQRVGIGDDGELLIQLQLVGLQ